MPFRHRAFSALSIFPVPSCHARPLVGAHPSTVVRRLAVTIGAEKLQVLSTVVEPVTVFVVDVKYQRFIKPAITQGTSFPFTPIFPSYLQQRSP
jgi:hypothetical protein